MARPAGVPKGKWGCPIIFFRPVTKTKTNRHGEEVEDKFCVMRRFTVFNVEQVEGNHLDHLRAGYAENVTDTSESLEAVDELIKNAGVDIFHGGNSAHYEPGIDAITMPHKHQFEGVTYYETLLHEMCHWAEHPDRLNWDRSEEGNSYAMGELVAEMGACFLCGELGIPFAEGLDNHAAYVGNWSTKLHDAVQIDPRFLTMRELVWMAEARSHHDWNHTAAVVALLANCHRDPKKHKTFKPTDFHPHTQRRSERMPTVPVSVLKQVFVDRQTGK